MNFTQVFLRIIAGTARGLASRYLARLLWRARHRRITLFWLVAALGLSLPWWLADGALWQAFPGGGHTYAACRVLNVYDGDTVTLNCGGGRERVRLHCIDAPEMGQVPWGRRSRDHLRRITPAQVRLVAHDRDRYGRLIGELYDGERSLNLALVEAGEAAVYPRYCRDPRYPRTERAARQAGLGIWAEPGQQQRPWEWRK